MNDVIVWAGWIGGLAIGLYGVLQVWVSGHPLGVSTAFGNICALAWPRGFFASAEYKKPLNWRLWFILGIPLGGFVAAISSPEGPSLTFSMGAMYDAALPAQPLLKGLTLLVGGIFIGLGSRMAGGCTSGHSIAGLAALNPPSLVASIGFFAGGIISVQVLFTLIPFLFGGNP